MRIGWLLALGACGRVGFGFARDDAGGDGDGRDAALASRCALSTAITCDGFETGTIDPPWALDTSQGTLAIDATRAYRGAYSVRAHTDPITGATTNPRALLRSYGGLPVTGRVYARAWMWFASPISANPMDQIINFADTPGNGISAGARNGFVVDNDYTSALYQQSTTVMLPLDRWTCVQFEMPSGTAGSSIVSIDGTPVADVTITKATVQPAPDHVYIGLEWVGTVSSLPASDTWIDEVIVDSMPTTCAD